MKLRWMLSAATLLLLTQLLPASQPSPPGLGAKDTA